MSTQLTIDPITRIEGHGKITLFLDNKGKVDDARFHITQFRGFEKFCEGRPFYEMPSLTARICGICPVSHLLTSAKACDQIMAVNISKTSMNLRRILHLAQYIQSHALSFFYLSSPDLLLGMDSDPAKRNIIGLIESYPTLATQAITLRKIGQEIIQWLGDKRVHPAWVVPGGVNKPLSAENRDKILVVMPQALQITQETIDWFKKSIDKYTEEIDTFANFPSLFMGLVTPEGGLEFYDGLLRIMDTNGKIVANNIDPTHYQKVIGEAAEPWSYMKFPYYKPKGYPQGLYRVGPMARLNVIDHCGTPYADKEWKEYRDRQKGLVLSAFYNHYARLIEILFAIEKMERLLNDPDILNPHVRTDAGYNCSEGIGVTEAPRGTLIHHYKVDENGLMLSANLIVATGHNNMAMNKGILQAAKKFVDGTKLKEGMLNRVEAVIRCFDPCLSCATHPYGQMPLTIQLINENGQVVDNIQRN